MIFDMTKRDGGGGTLPLGLVKVKDLIDETYTVETNITSGNSNLKTYTLSPLLQKDYVSSTGLVIIGYVTSKNEPSTSSRFYSSASFICIQRIYGVSYYQPYTQGRVDVGWTTNWSYCGQAQSCGMHLAYVSGNATELKLKLEVGIVNPVSAIQAGDYAVKAALYKFDVTALENSL